MAAVVVAEVQTFMMRANLQPRALYAAVIFLNQVKTIDWKEQGEGKEALVGGRG